MINRNLLGMLLAAATFGFISASPNEPIIDLAQVTPEKSTDKSKSSLQEEKKAETQESSQPADEKSEAAENSVKSPEEEQKPATEEKAPAEKPEAAPAKKAPESAPAEEKKIKEDKEEQETQEEEAKEPEKEEPEKAEKGAEKPAWEISASNVTVDNEQWTQIAVAVDVPIWRFGVCFDIELFLDAQGNFSNKGWNFDNKREVARTFLRKIRYIRFNHLGDPVFIKIGALDNVTFGYGFIVDRFSNMLRYPDEKLFGLQFDLNDLTKAGISLQTLIPDFMDFNNEGGILAARLAFKPLKWTEKPIIKGISIAGAIASDLNQYSAAKEWDYSLHGTKWDRDEDGITDSTYLYTTYGNRAYYTTLRQDHILDEDYDTDITHKDRWAKDTTNPATVVGADITVPIISSKLLNLDIYGQTGVMLYDENDDRIYKGWGIGIPGVAVKAGPIWSRLEYRHTEDLFAPGYFGPYYLEERIVRTPNVSVKEDSLKKADLNGVYGEVGCNIIDFFIVSASYQRLSGEDKMDLDQRVEASASVGPVLLERIPKMNKIELFYYQSDINNDDKFKRFFYQTPTTYWGYRLGCEVIAGASIIWETRYGWVWNKDKTAILDDKTMTIKAGLNF